MTLALAVRPGSALALVLLLTSALALSLAVATPAAVLVAPAASGSVVPIVGAGEPPAGAVKADLILPVTVSAQASPTSADVGQTVSFTCNASGGVSPYSYSWTFGDGDSGTGPTVSHAYASPGSMSATCTATDLALDTGSASVSVSVSSAPSVQASANRPSAAPGTALTFTAVASGGTGSFPRYDWTFGDGTSGSGAQTTHPYRAPGAYTATVVATDSNGGTASASVSVAISYVTVRAYVSATSGTISTTFNFTAFASGGAGAPYTFAWDFGDGTGGTGDAVTHRYAAPGNYTPTVTATDPLGAENRTVLSKVAVLSSAWVPGGALNVTILVSPEHPTVNESVDLQALAQGGTGAPTCSWDFGDGTTKDGCAVSHVWGVSGDYSVVVTATDPSGNRTSARRVVEIASGFQAVIVLSPDAPLSGQNASLGAELTGGSSPYNCTWDFGDANHTVGCTATHAWSSPGRYIVSLEVIDSQGHQFVVLRPVSVQPELAETSSGVSLALVALAASILIGGLAVYAWSTRSRKSETREAADLDRALSDLDRFARTGGSEPGIAEPAIHDAKTPTAEEAGAPPSLQRDTARRGSLGQRLLGLRPRPRGAENGAPRQDLQAADFAQPTSTRQDSVRESRPPWRRREE